MKPNFFQRLKYAITGNQGQKTFPAMGTGGMGMLVHSDPFIRAMEECGMNEYLKNPRASMPFYREAWKAIPFFDRAIHIKNSIIGIPCVTSENERLAEDINRILKEMSIFHPNIPNDPKSVGFVNLVRLLNRNSSRDGEAFSEIKYSDKRQRNFQGVCIHDAYNFDYTHQPGLGNHMLKLTHSPVDGKQQEFIEPSGNWIRKVYRQGDYPWGEGMLYGSRFFANLAVRIILSRRDLHMMKGNPPVITTISSKEELTNSSSAFQDAFTEKVTEIKKTHGRALSLMKQGKTVDILHGFPFGIEMQQSIYGQGAQGIQSATEEIKEALWQLSHVTNTPPQFLFNSSEGQGSKKFEVLMTLCKSDAKEARMDAEAVGDRLLTQIFTGQGIDISGQYKWEWQTPNLDDEKLEAEIDKTYTETAQQSLANITAITNQTTNPEEVRAAYIEATGHTWLESVDDINIEMPVLE